METQRSQGSSSLLPAKMVNVGGNAAAAAAVGFTQHPTCQGVLVLLMERAGVGYTCRLIAPASREDVTLYSKLCLRSN